MLSAVTVKHPDSPEHFYPCTLVGFGGVLCGRCGSELRLPVTVGDECPRCGVVVSQVVQTGVDGRPVGKEAA